jgi:uncharacterized protein
MKPLGKSRGIRPDYCFNRVIDISPAWLKERGFSGLMLDIDNTITRWEEFIVRENELKWLKRMQAAGLTCRLLSNGLPRKKAAVVKQTGIPHVTGIYVKPLRRSFRQGLTDLGLQPQQVLMVGDSVVTDVYSANRIGIWTCLVDPLSTVDFLGSKFYRLLENLFHLRRPAFPTHDFRHEAGGKGSSGLSS